MGYQINAKPNLGPSPLSGLVSGLLTGITQGLQQRAQERIQSDQRRQQSQYDTWKFMLEHGDAENRSKALVAFKQYGETGKFPKMDAPDFHEQAQQIAPMLAEMDQHNASNAAGPKPPEANMSMPASAGMPGNVGFGTSTGEVIPATPAPELKPPVAGPSAPMSAAMPVGPGSSAPQINADVLAHGSAPMSPIPMAPDASALQPPVAAGPMAGPMPTASPMQAAPEPRIVPHSPLGIAEAVSNGQSPGDAIGAAIAQNEEVDKKLDSFEKAFLTNWEKNNPKPTPDSIGGYGKGDTPEAWRKRRDEAIADDRKEQRTFIRDIVKNENYTQRQTKTLGFIESDREDRQKETRDLEEQKTENRKEVKSTVPGRAPSTAAPREPAKEEAYRKALLKAEADGDKEINKIINQSSAYGNSRDKPRLLREAKARKEEKIAEVKALYSKGDEKIEPPKANAPVATKESTLSKAAQDALKTAQSYLDAKIPPATIKSKIISLSLSPADKAELIKRLGL